MLKKKICIVIFSRANYGSIKKVLEEIKNSSKLTLQLIIGGAAIISRYGELENIIKNDGFKIDRHISFLIEGENNLTMAKSTGLAIIEIATALNELKPDLVFTVGDRFETISTAIAASYMNIPIAHTMGGEITGTIDESVRHAITKFSHLHFAATTQAKINIIKMGEKKNKVFNVGCPRIDFVKDCLKKKINLEEKVFENGVGNKFKLNNKNFICVMHYPVTTEYNDAREQIIETLMAVNEFNMPKIVFWPNSDAGSDKISTAIREWRENNDLKNYWFVKNLDNSTFFNLLNQTSCLVGNTSSGIREGAYMGVPFVNIGTRQKGREKSLNTINASYDRNDIKKKISLIINKNFKRSYIYGNGYAAKKIVKIIENIKNIEIQKKLNYKI
jgi:UDP-N-acetylglucosamine 2-epimerase